jgi:hypothetical protein
MGWLRKVGRKISKKLGKVFGSKLGAVIGAVGLYMLMGPVAKGLTGWAQSAFGGAAKAGATTATTATQAAATAASDAAAAEAIAASGIQSAGASAKLSETALLAGKENLAKQAVSTTATNQTVAGQIANATNNMDIANSAIAAIDSAAITGSTNVYPTITDSLINEAIPALEQPFSTVKTNLAEQSKLAFDSTKYTNLEAGKISPEMLKDSFNAPVSGQATSGPTVDFDAIAKDQQGLFAKGVDKVKGYFGDEFVGDTVQGVTTGLIMGELQSDYEEPFRSAGVASQPLSEAAQANYIQAVGPSAMAATGMTRMPSFQELSQQTLYGTGSSNYLSQFYQPLATPQAIG